MLMFQKLREFCAREEIRARIILVTLSLIVLVYAAVAALGYHLPGAQPSTPLFFRLHPERLLAMAAAVLGILRLIDHFQKGQDLIRPLLWILFASLVHLASIAVQIGWLSPKRD